MKKLLIGIVVLMSLNAHAGAEERVLEFKGSTFDYAVVKPDGGLLVQQAWEGYRVVQRSDGKCYRITHANLHIDRVGNGQQATFDETVSPDSCN